MTTLFVLLTFQISVSEELLLRPPPVVDDFGDIDTREAPVMDSNEQILANGFPVTTVQHVDDHEEQPNMAHNTIHAKKHSET